MSGRPLRRNYTGKLCRPVPGGDVYGVSGVSAYHQLNTAAHCILVSESAKKTHCSQALGRTYFTHVEKRQSKIHSSALVSGSQQVPLGGQRGAVGLPGLLSCCCIRSWPLQKGTDKAVGLATCHMMCMLKQNKRAQGKVLPHKVTNSARL